MSHGSHSILAPSPASCLIFIDGFLPLVLLAVNHDHAGPVEHEGTGDFVAETENVMIRFQQVEFMCRRGGVSRAINFETYPIPNAPPTTNATLPPRSWISFLGPITG